MQAIDPKDAPELLATDRVDLAIAPFAAPPSHLMTRELFRVPFVLAMRSGHPLSATPDLAELARYPHVAVSFVGPVRTAVDTAFETAGLTRHVGVVLTSFLAVPHALAASDALAILPAPFAQGLEREGRLKCAPLPSAIALPPLRMRLLWSARTDRAPAWMWMRDRIVAVLPRRLAPEGARR